MTDAPHGDAAPGTSPQYRGVGGRFRRHGGVFTALVAATLTVAGLVACSGTSPVEQTGAGTVVEIEAVDNVFRPETIEIEPGTEVRWVNGGRNAHDVKPTDTSLGDWGIELAGFEPGATYSHVFTEPGEYPYYCTAHGTRTRGMIGTIVVTG